MEETITKRQMFAEINQEIREGGKTHVFAIKYVKKDGTLGQKERVSKSQKLPSGTGKYRGNVNYNHVLLLFNHAINSAFEVHIDLITHYNNKRINHRA